jgi:hypothetical protein
MALRRQAKIVVWVSGTVLAAALLGFAFLSWFADRLKESDLIWVGTRQFGMSLIIYAQEHGGRYPQTLSETDFAASLSSRDRTLLQRLRFEYTPPRAGFTNVVRLLAGHSRTRTSAFYSDGSVTVTNR